MDGQAIITVSAAVVALTQLVKRLGIPTKMAPLVVLSLSALGVALWGYSAVGEFTRQQIFSYFAGWIAVATAATGAYEASKQALEKDRERDIDAKTQASADDLTKQQMVSVIKEEVKK